MKKYTKEELYKMDAVDVYKMVLKGEVIKTFPKGFWQQPEAKQNAAKCTKFLIEEILKYNEETLKNKNSVNIFSKNKLLGMLTTCFGDSPYDAINNAYPNKYKQWEFKNVPMGYWQNKENGVKATKWLIEEKLKLSDKELKEKLSIKLFLDNGFSGMLTQCFKNSPYDAINSTYPNKYREWEFKTVPTGYWNNKENGTEATKWLIEEKLKLSDDQLKDQLCRNIFQDNGLYGMLTQCFKNSPYEAINSAYPGKFKHWEFKQAPNGYWHNKENGIKATKWLIEEKLKLSDGDIKQQLSVKLFEENGLYGMLQYCFNSSPYEAINSAYPGKFNEWEFKNVPMGYWTKENGIKATKWLIERKLKLDEKDIKKELSTKLFENNGLGGMLIQCFNGSVFNAINEAYPNKFKKEDFTNYYNQLSKKEKENLKL